MEKIFIFFILIQSVHLFANEDGDFQLNGSVMTQGFFLEDSEGGYIRNLRTALQVDGSLDLTEDGCVQLKGKISTGDKFNSIWDTTGIGDSDSNMNINIKHIYIQSNCLAENVNVSVGAMAPNNFGRLGISPYGWVDGVKVVVRDEANKREWVASVGSVNQLDDVNAFQRSYGDINHYGMEVNQRFGAGHNVFISVDEFDDALFARSGIRLAVQKYLGFIDSVAAEVATKDGGEVGNFFEVKAGYGEWEARVFRADLEPITVDGESGDQTLQQTKYYYGLGENYFVEASRPFGNRDRYQGLIRFRDGDAGKMAVLQLRGTFGR